MILADAGVLLAAANRDEAKHEACVALLEQSIGALLVCPLVVAEVCYMLGTRYGPEAEALFFGLANRRHALAGQAQRA